MANLLHIVASPRTESYSTQLAKAFLDAYREAQPEDYIETLDLYRHDIPPFYAPAAKAKWKQLCGECAGAIGSLVVAIALMVYGFWFYRKMKRLRIIT